MVGTVFNYDLAPVCRSIVLEATNLFSIRDWTLFNFISQDPFDSDWADLALKSKQGGSSALKNTALC